jgi:hypothetical protein
MIFRYRRYHCQELALEVQSVGGVLALLGTGAAGNAGGISCFTGAAGSGVADALAVEGLRALAGNFG